MDDCPPRLAEATFNDYYCFMDIHALVVDDSRAILDVMDAMLEDLNVGRTHCCNSGAEALHVIETQLDHFNMCFIDLNMPGVDGMDLIRHLGEKQFGGAVVIVSAMDDRVIALAADIARMHQVYLGGCLAKPVDEKKLSSVIHKYRLLLKKKQNGRRSMDVDSLEEAINNHQLQPYFQPVIDKTTSKVLVMEVLARIVRPGSVNAILPSEFIEVASRTGKLEQMTFDLIESALDEFKLNAEQFGDCRLAFNLTPELLENRNLAEILFSLVERHRFLPEQIIFEITEEKMVSSATQLECMNRLRMKGFGLALDDFGTGFTNLQQLKTLPFTEVKLDRSFIYDIANDRLSQVVLQSLVSISKQLDISLIAEGIEQPHDFEYINNLDVEIMLQGYIISRPKDMGALSRWKHGWDKNIAG